MNNFLFIPSAMFSADDAAARKRKEIAEKLRKGQDVNITRTGEVVSADDLNTSNDNTLVVPAGKLAASFYWYERDPILYKAECDAMQAYFPQFILEKLDDGRLCWIGTLNPRGNAGGVWTIQAVYDHNHPHNDSYGGSVKIYSIKPALEDLVRETDRLPHILTDNAGNFYMCTARMEDVNSGKKKVTSAVKSLGWAVRWIWVVEGWLSGELGDEVFDHDNF